MNINLLLPVLLRQLFRSIPEEYRESLQNYVDSVVSDEKNEKDRSTLQSVLNMSLDAFKRSALDLCFNRGISYDSFFSACIILRIIQIEANSVFLPISKNGLAWRPYTNRSQRSSVRCYSIGDSFLAVAFINNPKVYVYSYKKTGFLGTELMKLRATDGWGLGSITASYFRDHKGFSILY